MVDLQRVDAHHEAALLAFESTNRAYFTRSISDRGDTFFERYPERHRDLMAEQESGVSAYYVSVDDRGAVQGRFNLYRLSGGTAEVGYRIAERCAGQGMATSGVRALCRIARHDLGLSSLTAATSDENVASQHVLVNAGFTYVEPTEVGGRPGRSFAVDLTAI